MSKAPSWTRVDESVYLHCCPEPHTHAIYYYRIYTSGKTYSYSTTNDLISNFQKGPLASANILPYRQWAIQKFADELGELASQFNSAFNFYIVPTPPSKLRTNPEYDSRVEEVALKVAAKFPHINVSGCIETVRDVEKTKSNLEPRSVERIYDILSVVTEKLPPDEANTVVFILDDVLTSGSHFEAIRRRLREHLSKAIIGGIFWARASQADVGE